MTLMLQDGIVSMVALGAVAAIVIRARGLFAEKPSGSPCGSCSRCPSASKSANRPQPLTQILRSRP